MANLKHIRRSGREKLLSALGLPSRAQVRLNHREGMYLQAFLDLKASLGISMPFFPFGGAANASLLYLLARAVNELPIAAVCELGSGQSTLLFDALAGSKSIEVDSFEQREFWANAISARIQNPDRVRVHASELRDQTVRGHSAAFYGLGSSIEGKRFNLLVVDGPSGTKRRSRWGSLQLIDGFLSDDFLIVFDDAERIGEMDTCNEAVKLLKEKGAKVFTETVEAAKSQFLIASESMRAACYF